MPGRQLWLLRSTTVLGRASAEYSLYPVSRRTARWSYEPMRKYRQYLRAIASWQLVLHLFCKG